MSRSPTTGTTSAFRPRNPLAALAPTTSTAQRLQNLATDDIEATASVLPLTNVWREDVARPCLPTEDVLANAPNAEDNHFRVAAVLEEE